MIASYRYTPCALEDSYEPRKGEIAKWAAGWTNVMANMAGGLDVGARSDIFLALHEIRKRVLAGDYGPPDAPPSAQMDLSLPPANGVCELREKTS